jgi:general transcription factor 3C polypeptide 3 (transcription factor C subunit 4)
LNYFDLYRSVADRLQAAELYQHALGFYQPLKQVSEESTRDLYVQMGRCYLKENLQGEAEECFHTAIQLDNNNTEARVQLAKMYESLNEQEQAFIYVNEVLAIKRMENPEPVKARRRRQGRAIVKTQAVESKESSESENEDLTPVKYYTYKRRRLADPKKKLEEERSRADEVKSQYHVFRTKLEGMRLGDPGATRAWMMAARDLTDDFRSVRKFYPYDKYASFLGYKEKDLRAQIDGQTEVPTEEGELSAMADRLSQRSFSSHMA